MNNATASHDKDAKAPLSRLAGWRICCCKCDRPKTWEYQPLTRDPHRRRFFDCDVCKRQLAKHLPGKWVPANK